MRPQDVPSLRSQLLVLAALLLLLAASAGLSRLSLGWWTTVITTSIAIGQALLVMVVFMRLKSAHPALRMIAIVGFARPMLLEALALGDYLTRSLLPAPWR
jgi:caa(3)-type oxidase subunit IV